MKATTQLPYTDNLEPGFVVTVTPDTGATARVTINALNGTSSPQVISSATVFGPYMAEVNYRIDVLSGVSATITEAASANNGAVVQWNADHTAIIDPVTGEIAIRKVASYTWANRPSAASNTGVVIRITDIGGSAGSRWISDGTYWKPESGRVVLAASGAAVSCDATTNENALATFTLPAYSMGVNGILNIVATWSYTNSANNKIVRIRFGGIAGERLLDSTQTTTASLRTWTEWQNRNRTDQQAGGTGQSSSLLAGGIGAAVFTSTQSTIIDQPVILTGTKASGAEVLTLERYVAELIVP